jgi:hypothetical protein
MSKINIRELTLSLRYDYLYFFDKVALADNTAWRDCYCSLYHIANRERTEACQMAGKVIEENRIQSSTGCPVRDLKSGKRSDQSCAS